jgi:nucleoside-diphosphate-sugar epimerase
MAVWLITGASGFVGRHVLNTLTAGVDGRPAEGHEVVVLGRRCPADWPARSFISADLNNREHLRQAVQSISPDFVIHTAGRTPPASDEELYVGNFWTTMHLLSALRTLKKRMRVVLSGSAAELGPVDAADLPVNERYSCLPTTAYGRSKWLATRSGLAERPPLEVMVGRVFNPIGPGTPISQALGRFADRLSDAGPDPLGLSVGELETRRDFIDVRDVARALVAISLRGQPGLVYHVGTGRSRRVGDGLDRLIGLSGRTVQVSVDQALRYQSGPTDSRADIKRIVSHTQWNPTIAWEQSLDDLWREARDRRRSPRIEESAAA